MGNVIRVQVDALTTQSKNATDAADEIGQQLAGLCRRMNNLAGIWTGGTAAPAYLEVWDEISNECHGMIEDLTWIGKSLAAAASAYARMEQTAVDTFHQVQRTTPRSGGV